jgi:O-antigen/teichoic acid export membrane protein
MPLITVPYVSRILGKEGIGVFGYTFSVSQYFVIMGTLGIAVYGNRQIAYVRDNKEEMSRTFWSIAFLQFITTSIALAIYILIYGFNKVYGKIYMIQSINIAAAMIDISWLFMGLEDFKKTVTRNLAVKVIGVVCIFIFVKEYADLNKYVIINALMFLMGNLVMWMYVSRTVLKIKINFKDIMKHICPSLRLFIPQIAIQIYVVLDKIMLGSLANIGEVGLFEQSEKIIKLILGLVTSLGVVMLPRMSNIFAKGNNEKMDEYLNKSLQGVSYVSIPMAFGLAAISNEFVPWFFGKDFNSVSYLMITLSPILFFIAISSVLGTQYLLPSNRTNQFTATVTIGAIINVILNLILIPKYKAVGTCIATVIAEFAVTFSQYLYVRKNIKMRALFKSVVKYVVAGTIMFIIVRLVGMYMGAKIISTIMQGVIGVIIYILILMLFKEENNLAVAKYLTSKLRKIWIRLM